MYCFNDKKGRDICLIPEVTAIIQKQFKEKWSKTLPKPLKLFYISRCYRYEKPQKGRYREFIQFGIEYLGGKDEYEEVTSLLKNIINSFDVENKFCESIKRGLDYYVENGFEVECPKLGAQKQVAGGGRYDCGIGFAIGVDRLVLAIQEENKGV